LCLYIFILIRTLWSKLSLQAFFSHLYACWVCVWVFFSNFACKFLKVLCFFMQVVFACFFTSFVYDSFCFFYAFARRTFHLCLHFFILTSDFLLKFFAQKNKSHLCTSCVCAHFFLNFVYVDFCNFCLHRSFIMRFSNSMFFSIHLIHVVLQMQKSIELMISWQ
jgi:hypothetical protein